MGIKAHALVRAVQTAVETLTQKLKPKIKAVVDLLDETEYVMEDSGFDAHSDALNRFCDGFTEIMLPFQVPPDCSCCMVSTHTNLAH